jgi:hypothetical protein
MVSISWVHSLLGAEHFTCKVLGHCVIFLHGLCTKTSSTTVRMDTQAALWTMPSALQRKRQCAAPRPPYLPHKGDGGTVACGCRSGRGGLSVAFSPGYQAPSTVTTHGRQNAPWVLNDLVPTSWSVPAPAACTVARGLIRCRRYKAMVTSARERRV